MSDNPVERYMRVTPQNDLDLQFMVTEPVWGKEEGVNKEVNKSLKDALRILSYLNRDLRLANLDAQELIYVRYYLDLAGDIITENLNLVSYNTEEEFIMLEPFIICVKNVASICETSQGKKGFLRRMFNTLFSDSTNRTDEPPKKSIFTGKSKSGGD